MLEQELPKPAALTAPARGVPSDLSQRAIMTILAVAVGVLLAGFWNFKFFDGLGRTVFAHPLVGDSHAAASGQATAGFGFLFAIAAGLAASFTACNCVVYAMLPGLTCSVDSATRKTAAWRALGLFALAVVAVCFCYGLYVGALGAPGAAHLNSQAVRMRQAETVFTVVGIVMLVWGLLEMGWGGQLGQRGRHALETPLRKAVLMGILVGLFAVGRPYPVFRDFLIYAAHMGSLLTAAAAMALQGLGQIAVMALLFGIVAVVFGKRLAAWTAADPARPARLSASALVAGGAYFIYYWGFALALHIGQWGFKLGWYH